MVEKMVAEIFGTAVLILLGDGVVAGVLLAKSKAQNSVTGLGRDRSRRSPGCFPLPPLRWTGRDRRALSAGRDTPLHWNLRLRGLTESQIILRKPAEPYESGASGVEAIGRLAC